jgi:hypothetical protein
MSLSGKKQTTKHVRASAAIGVEADIEQLYLPSRGGVPGSTCWDNGLFAWLPHDW